MVASAPGFRSNHPQRSADEEARGPKPHRLLAYEEDRISPPGFSTPVSALTVDLVPLRRGSRPQEELPGGTVAPPAVDQVLRRRRAPGAGQAVDRRAGGHADAAGDTAASALPAPLRRSQAAPRDGGIVRRMAINGTNWASATSASHSSGGTVGVVIVQDGGTPVAVKAGEEFLPEAAVAATVLTAAVEGTEGGWTASAPVARPVDATEARLIKTRLEALLPADQLASDRTQRFLGALDTNNGVMVYGFAAGEELEGAMTGAEQTKETGLLGKRTLRKDSISYQMMNDPGMMRMFGRASAGDILLGNSDRFAGKINLQNVLVDQVAKSISLIDNVEANNETALRAIPVKHMTAKLAFDTWTRHYRVAKLAKGDLAGIAEEVIENLGDGMRLLPLKPQDRPALMKAFAANRPKMQVWFEAGLHAGIDSVLKALEDPVKITASLPRAVREEAMTSLIARRLFAGGMVDAAKAWAVGLARAKELMNSVPMPALPATPAPPANLPPLPATPANRRGRPTTPAPGGHRAAALASH